MTLRNSGGFYSVPGLLSAVSSSHFEDVAIAVQNNDENDYMAFWTRREWKLIDETLAGPAYGNLVVVMVEYSGDLNRLPPEYQCTMGLSRVLFPRLGARNMLRPCQGNCAYHP